MRFDALQQGSQECLRIDGALHDLRGAFGGDDSHVGNADETEYRAQIGGDKIQGRHRGAFAVGAAAGDEQRGLLIFQQAFGAGGVIGESFADAHYLIDPQL